MEYNQNECGEVEKIYMKRKTKEVKEEKEFACREMNVVAKSEDGRYHPVVRRRRPRRRCCWGVELSVRVAYNNRRTGYGNYCTTIYTYSSMSNVVKESHCHREGDVCY